MALYLTGNQAKTLTNDDSLSIGPLKPIFKIAAIGPRCVNSLRPSDAYMGQ